MKKHLERRIGLSLWFSLVSLVNFMITACVIGFFALLISAFQSGNHPEPWVIILAVLAACVIVGTLVSMIVGRLPLRPIHKIIEATNKLAQGDFSARLEITRPQEFNELANSFNRMATELGSTEMLRADFIDNFSHEFKTPIVSIKGFAEELRYDDLSVEERREYLDIIIKESARLAQLSTEILELSKVEHQTMLIDTERFNLTEQIRCAIVMLENHWEAKNLSLYVDMDEVECVGNKDMLNRVWLNLLDNAIKFTPKNGTIEVRLRNEGDALVIQTQDSGTGIREAALDHIFDKFYQADESHSTIGNGLGLAAAKRIIELHGGTIAAESTESLGSTFTTRIPVIAKQNA